MPHIRTYPAYPNKKKENFPCQIFSDVFLQTAGADTMITIAETADATTAAMIAETIAMMIGAMTTVTERTMTAGVNNRDQKPVVSKATGFLYLLYGFRFRS